MDPFNMTFYAAVCGTLAAVAPAFRTAAARVLAGAGVGLAAAALLPFARGMFGF